MRYVLLFALIIVACGTIHCGKPGPLPGDETQNNSSGDGATVTEPSKESSGKESPGKESPGSTEVSQEPSGVELSQEPNPPVETTPDASTEPAAPDIPGVPEPGPELVQESTPTPEPGPEPPSSDTDTAWLAQVTCKTPPPPGATLAPQPPAYSGGQCPTLKAGMNTIKSKGNDRKFILVLPSNPQPGEVYPVLFMWHWLKSSANKFLSQGDVQKSVDQQRFIAIIPESKGDLNLLVTKIPWPFLEITPQARYDEEFTFFDDMLSCVSQQFKVNKECVSSVGVSAGALFTAQLASARSNYLASFLSLSGGTDEVAAAVAKLRSWKPSQRKLPGLVLWGGPQDSCVLLNFEKASQKLEQHLQKHGHFFIECVHNCKHAEPPITPRPGKSKYESLWDFFLRHPFWLKDGESPFKVTPWPYSNVPWCGIGAGSATPRTGTCPPPACPI